MQKKKVFNEKVDELVKLGKPKIAFGLKEIDEEILDSLRKGKNYADIVLVGNKEIEKIKDFEIITDEEPEERLAGMLAKDEVEGIIRGTIDDFKTYETYEKLTGEKYIAGLGLVEDLVGRQFFLASASNPEGWEKEEKLEKTKLIAEFISAWGIKPDIAVFAGERHDTYPRKKHIRDGVVGILNKTYEDAEWVVENLKKAGYDAKNWSIDLNPAIEAGVNIVVPVNGMIANQMIRVWFLCGGKILSGTRIGLSRAYEDNSRTEKNFLFHVKWLVAMINKKKYE